MTVALCRAWSQAGWFIQFHSSFSRFLAIRGFLYFHTNCEIICSSSVKNTVGSLIGIALNLYTALGSIFIFTILILPIREHGIFLHLFVSSLTSFISVLWFSIYRSFVSLGRYIPKYFIQHGNGEWNCFLNFSIFSLLVYRTEKAMAPHSSTLAWKIHGWRSLVGCSPQGH